MGVDIFFRLCRPFLIFKSLIFDRILVILGAEVREKCIHPNYIEEAFVMKAIKINRKFRSCGFRRRLHHHRR